MIASLLTNTEGRQEVQPLTLVCALTMSLVVTYSRVTLLVLPKIGNRDHPPRHESHLWFFCESQA